MANFINTIKQAFRPKTIQKQAKTPANRNIFFRNNLNFSPSWNNFENRNQFLSTYYDVPEYSAIKNYMATNFAALRWELENIKTGEIINEHPILDILAKPNPFQAHSEFLVQFYLNWKVFGNAYIFKLMPDSFENSTRIEDIQALFVLPSQYTFIVGANVNPLLISKREELIKKYTIVYNGMLLLDNINPKTVLHKNEPNLDFDLTNCKYLYGKPDQISLDWALSNIKAVYEAENVLINNKGALGIISNESNKEHGFSLPFDPEHKLELQSDFERYGLKSSKLQYIITNLAMKFTPISFPIKDLMLNEIFNRSVSALCSANKFPKLLLNAGQDSTFNNQEQADKQLFQNALIPQAIDVAEALTSFFSLEEQNLILRPNFSHVAALKEDEKLNADTTKIKNDTCQNQYENGLITKNEWLKILGREPINNPDFDKYNYELLIEQNNNNEQNPDTDNE